MAIKYVSDMEPVTELNDADVLLIDTGQNNRKITWAALKALLGTVTDLTVDNAAGTITITTADGQSYTVTPHDPVKQDTLTFDATPASGSANPVTSGGVFAALSGKADAAAVYTKAESDALLAEKQDTLTFDAAPASGSANPVTSGGVFAALSGKQDTLSFDTMPTAGSGNPVTSGGIRAALDDISQAVVYGFHIDSAESDPSASVTYLRDAIGLTPAYMDFTADVFRWGGWANAFFLPRPCMLRYDGTVDYYLDPDDYSKREDGTASDVADVSYQGNAMMEWGQGGKKIWYKIIPDAGDNTSASVYIANFQSDSGYHAWSFINNQGELVDHFYTPIYNGSIDGDGRLRSLSGMTNTALCQGKTAAEEIAAAELNNPATDKLWYTEVYADITLINLLLILMGKSTNTQAIFGRGGRASGNPMLNTGTMNDKGMFWGDQNDGDGVKVFGMEHWWGNQWRRYAGHILASRVNRYKMTAPYNTTGEGYTIGGSAPQADGYIAKMTFDENCFAVKAVGGTSSTYWCDYFYQTTGTLYAFRGGASSSTDIGAFITNTGIPAASKNSIIGAALSCKPLKGA
jgi:hypothetical protein